MNVRLGELKIKELFSLGELKLANMTVNGGGYERGYEAGYSKGETDGYGKGFTEGQAEGYDTGYAEGEADGYAKGEAVSFEAGKEAGNKEFWDDITQNNTRTDYTYAFGYAGFTDKTFKPPYTLKPKNASYMFLTCNQNLKEGIYNYPPDFSQCTDFNQAFARSHITKLPILDMRSGTNFNMTFFATWGLEWIDGIYLPPNVSLGNMFLSTYGSIRHCIFLNEISATNLQLGNECRNFDKESLESVMNNLSTTTSGRTITLSLTAVNREYETSEGANDGSTSPEWENKVAARPNWTINLV